jgi:glyoxylase-like metal-dependent hydrolase (beta-lactamase superfamily II)
MNATKSETAWVRQLALGPMKNFVYLVGSPHGEEVAVIDPAWDAEAILSAARAESKRITAIVLSHHHFDHINAVSTLLDRLDIPVYAQRAEVDFSEAVRGFGDAVRPVGPGEVISVGGAELTCIHTPGHTPGSQCILCGGALVSGDTVFVNACGRCDLAGSDPAQMFDSLHHVLRALPGQTRLFPGHDYGDVITSTLSREREQNPYFQLRKLPEFLAHRMRPRG